jgi:putative ABC transport system permease protein
MTELFMALRIAMRAIRANTMRSFLTMLGIIIGIGAVIVMVAVGAGATRMIGEQIASVGSNLILVLPGSATSGGMRAGAGSLPTLTSDDARAIKAECPSVVLASPTVRGSAQLVYGNMNWSTVLQGVSPDFLDIREWTVAAGRGLIQADLDSDAKVCVLGATVAETLFGAEDPVGKSVRIKSVPFAVAGVLEAKGQSPGGQDQDDVALVPLTTAQHKLLGAKFLNTVGSIMVKARDEEALESAEQEITDLLDQRHRTSQGKERDFTVRNLSEMLALAQQSARIMSLLLGAVASISLLVGGIGIMNIMLVSVTERTREIGIRVAIGARRRDIMLQFLTEATLLTLTGGVLGILLGWAGAFAVSKALDWPVLIAPEAVLVAVTFSGAVGLFFGFYPARKAASLNPIDALRYE